MVKYEKAQHKTGKFDPGGRWSRILDALLDNAERFTGGEYKVLTQLLRLSHGEEKPDCRIGAPALARRCGYSARYTQNVLRILEQGGAITRLEIGRRGSRYSVNADRLANYDARELRLCT